MLPDLQNGCVAPGCSSPVFVSKRALCKTHYHRVMRSGSLSVERAEPSACRVCSVDGWPPGQRIEDKVEWAVELLRMYRPELLK